MSRIFSNEERGTTYNGVKPFNRQDILFCLIRQLTSQATIKRGGLIMSRKKLLVSFSTILLLVFLSVQPAFAYSNVVLKNGMSSGAVTQLQKDLKALGFMSINPTGYFGDITKAAVIKFQKKYDLTTDGIAGPQTLAKIDKLSGRPKTLSRGDTRSTGQKITDYAKKFLGVDYVWGGASPKGFDCSGFVKYVYSKFGITLNRVSADQAKQGTTVKKANLKAGDLVFFDTNGGRDRINHVGLYIGSGKFIQASSGHSGVVISTISGGFYSGTFMKAKRVIS